MRGKTHFGLAAIGAMIAFLGGAISGQNVLLVPSTYPTIGSALTAAVSGDRIEVSPGIYPEHIDFLGKDVELVSTGGWEVTIITGAGQVGRMVSFVNGETRAAVGFQGFVKRTAWRGRDLEGERR